MDLFSTLLTQRPEEVGLACQALLRLVVHSGRHRPGGDGASGTLHGRWGSTSGTTPSPPTLSETAVLLATRAVLQDKLRRLAFRDESLADPDIRAVVDLRADIERLSRRIERGLGPSAAGSAEGGGEARTPLKGARQMSRADADTDDGPASAETLRLATPRQQLARSAGSGANGSFSGRGVDSSAHGSAPRRVTFADLGLSASSSPSAPVPPRTPHSGEPPVELLRAPASAPVPRGQSPESAPRAGGATRLVALLDRITGVRDGADDEAGEEEAPWASSVSSRGPIPGAAASSPSRSLGGQQARALALLASVGCADILAQADVQDAGGADEAATALGAAEAVDVSGAEAQPRPAAVDEAPGLPPEAAQRHGITVPSRVAPGGDRSPLAAIAATLGGSAPRPADPPFPAETHSFSAEWFATVPGARPVTRVLFSDGEADRTSAQAAAAPPTSSPHSAAVLRGAAALLPVSPPRDAFLVLGRGAPSVAGPATRAEAGAAPAPPALPQARAAGLPAPESEMDPLDEALSALSLSAVSEVEDGDETSSRGARADASAGAGAAAPPMDASASLSDTLPDVAFALDTAAPPPAPWDREQHSPGGANSIRFAGGGAATPPPPPPPQEHQQAGETGSEDAAAAAAAAAQSPSALVHGSPGLRSVASVASPPASAIKPESSFIFLDDERMGGASPPSALLDAFPVKAAYALQQQLGAGELGRDAAAVEATSPAAEKMAAAAAAAAKAEVAAGTSSAPPPLASPPSRPPPPRSLLPNVIVARRLFADAASAGLVGVRDDAAVLLAPLRLRPAPPAPLGASVRHNAGVGDVDSGAEDDGVQALLDFARSTAPPAPDQFSSTAAGTAECAPVIPALPPMAVRSPRRAETLAQASSFPAKLRKSHARCEGSTTMTPEKTSILRRMQQQRQQQQPASPAGSSPAAGSAQRLAGAGRLSPQQRRSDEGLNPPRLGAHHGASPRLPAIEITGGSPAAARAAHEPLHRESPSRDRRAGSWGGAPAESLASSPLLPGRDGAAEAGGSPGIGYRGRRSVVLSPLKARGGATEDHTDNLI